MSAWLLYAAREPRSKIGQLTFYTIYQFAPSRPVFLPFYSRCLYWGDGGYIPPTVDAFLCARLATASSGEFSSIVSFYIAQSGGRLGQSLGQVSDDTKAKVIEGVISKLDRLDPLSKLRAVELVEYLRLDGVLYKPSLLGSARWDEKGQFVLVPEIIDQAAVLYTRWWRDPAVPWPAKKKVSPLDGSGLYLGSP